jgi:hypothetical protein
MRPTLRKWGKPRSKFWITDHQAEIQTQDLPNTMQLWRSVSWLNYGKISWTVFHFRVQNLRIPSPPPCRPFLGPTQPPFLLAPGDLRPKSETDHSPPSWVEVKNAWSYTSIPMSSRRGAFIYPITPSEIRTPPRYLYTNLLSPIPQPYNNWFIAN